jgi:hypothetical protein
MVRPAACDGQIFVVGAGGARRLEGQRRKLLYVKESFTQRQLGCNGSATILY